MKVVVIVGATVVGFFGPNLYLYQSATSAPSACSATSPTPSTC